MPEYKVVRVLRWFANSDELYRGDCSIDHIPLETLRRIVNAGDDDPLLYGCYPVSVEQALLLREFIQLEFDYEHFSYFVECDRVD